MRPLGAALSVIGLIAACGPDFIVPSSPERAVREAALVGPARSPQPGDVVAESGYELGQRADAATQIADEADATSLETRTTIPRGDALAETADAEQNAARDLAAAGLAPSDFSFRSELPKRASSEPPNWDAAPNPIIIGHRGSGNIAAPENTIAAFDYAAPLGVPLETDVVATRDGYLILNHDGSFSRVTAGAVTASTSSLTLDQVRTIDVSPVYRPDLFSPQRVPTFEEYLRRYGRTNLLLPEIKNNYLDATAMAQMVKRFGLTQSVAIQCTGRSSMALVKAVDPRIRTVWLDSNKFAVAEAVANGVWAVLNHQMNVDAPYVSAMHAAGVKVFVYTVNGLTDAERFIGYGVDGLVTDDPALLLQANRFTPRGNSTVAPPASLVGSGWRPYASAGAGWTPTVATGFVSFGGMSVVGDTNYSQLFLPGIRLSAAYAADQTIAATLKLVKAPTSGNPASSIGVHFAWNRDGDLAIKGTTASNGYYFAYKLGGAVEITKVTNGTATYGIGSARWPALAEGQAIPLRIDLTATSIRVTRTDTGHTVSAADSTHARTGFVNVFGLGAVAGVGQVTVTY